MTTQELIDKLNAHARTRGIIVNFPTGWNPHWYAKAVMFRPAAVMAGHALLTETAEFPGDSIEEALGKLVAAVYAEEAD